MDKIEAKEVEIKPLEVMRKTSDKVEGFQEQYNITSKNFAYILGKNLTLFICMLVPLILISCVWTDFAAIVIGPRMFSDAVLTVTLFAVGEIMMQRLGSDGGRLDAEFKSAKKEYDLLRIEVGDLGTFLMGVFCDWQIDQEMEQAIQFRLRIIRMTPKMWEEVKKLSYEDLEKKFGKKRAKKMKEILELQPIELNEAILLYNGENASRGGVPISGEAYLRNAWRIAEMVLACIFTGLLTVTVAITLTKDITFARVLYTAFKLLMLLFRMAKGYDKGAWAYNTIEVRQLKAKSNYLRQYIKFVKEKIYLNLGDKYGDISTYESYENTSKTMQNNSESLDQN